MRTRHPLEEGSPAGLWSGWKRTYLPFRTQKGWTPVTHLGGSWQKTVTILSKALTAKKY